MALRGKPDAALDRAAATRCAAALPKWGQAFLLRAMALGKADADADRGAREADRSELTVTDGKAIVHETTPGDEYELYMTSRRARDRDDARRAARGRSARRR